MTAGPSESPCPSCGRSVPTTVGGPGTGDQLASGEVTCPGCGATLIRAVDGPADRGWRLAGSSA
jgi:ribosomal protein S27E